MDALFAVTLEFPAFHEHAWPVTQSSLASSSLSLYIFPPCQATLHGENHVAQFPACRTLNLVVKGSNLYRWCPFKAAVACMMRLRAVANPNTCAVTMSSHLQTTKETQSNLCRYFQAFPRRPQIEIVYSALAPRREHFRLTARYVECRPPNKRQGRAVLSEDLLRNSDIQFCQVVAIQDILIPLCE